MPRKIPTARFAPGTMIRHRRFGYRGLIFDVDAKYSQPEEWYDLMTDTNPPKDKPWYHVLVDGEKHTTYVAEDNLECCFEADDFQHPLFSHLFSASTTHSGQFQVRQLVN